MKLALTGSIGMGKSTVAGMFKAAGIPVFDADAEVRRLQVEDAQLLAAIEGRFPGTVVEGRLDRDRLSAAVFGKPTELAALEALVHPAVEQARERFSAEHAGAPAILFDMPLLFETGADRAFDTIIVVSAPADVQRARVLARAGMTADKLDRILARQTPDAEKRRRADFVIDTGGELSTTQAQVRRILACLGLDAGR